MPDPTTNHGYSGKPLFQKLGMKPGMRCIVMNAPAHYPALIAGAEGLMMLQPPGPADLVHLFCSSRLALEKDLAMALSALAPGGMLWLSWPKKSSPLFRDLTEDTLREVVLPTGWVDVKVCAVDQDWSGLKFLMRRK